MHYYQYEKFIKAFYSMEEIKYNGENVKVIKYVKSKIDGDPTLFYLSNGKIIKLKSNLDYFEDIKFDWEGANNYIKKNNDSNIKTDLMLGIILKLMNFIDEHKEHIDIIELNSLKDEINIIWSDIKGLNI